MKNSFFISIFCSLFVLLPFSGNSNADACPQGMITNPVGAGGQPQCVPGENHQNWGGGAGSSEPSYGRRWGAIAMDNSSGKTGIAGSMPSKRKAEKSAIAQCQQKGGRACKVELTYYNQCGALAWGGGKMSTAHAPTENEAGQLAVNECQRGAEKCEVFFSDCSYAERTN